MIKCQEQNSLWKKEFLWAYSSRGRAHTDRVTIATGTKAGSWESTSYTLKAWLQWHMASPPKPPQAAPLTRAFVDLSLWGDTSYLNHHTVEKEAPAEKGFSREERSYKVDGHGTIHAGPHTLPHIWLGELSGSRSQRRHPGPANLGLQGKTGT